MNGGSDALHRSIRSASVWLVWAGQVEQVDNVARGDKPTVGLWHAHCHEIWKTVTCEAIGKAGVTENDRA